MWKSFVLELHGEWSELADEYLGLLSLVENGNRFQCECGGVGKKMLFANLQV